MQRLISTFASVAALASLASGCANTPSEPHPSMQDASLWSYGIDPHGTRAEFGDSLIQDGIAQIAFHRVPRPSPQENSWIELIYYAPEGHLAGVESMTLRYQSSEPLLVKFSQSDFGADGDNTFAHYQAEVPAADQWHSVELFPEDFSRPDWTPADSEDVGLRLQNVDAVYLAPSLDDETGGYAELKVKAIELHRADF